MSRRLLLVLVAGVAALTVALLGTRMRDSAVQNPETAKLRLRLQWVPQAQFAGYLVADKLGFYKEEGLSVTILPAGPDIKPQNTVASGSDDLGIGVANQVVMARSEGVPLKIIAQIFRDSANRYILKSQNRIRKLADIKGKKVGLWLGGDEAEFIAMLAKVGLKLNDVIVIPQEFSVTPFLQDQYVLSQVTTYNELIQVRDAGFEGDKLQILSPKDFDANIVGDMIFTTERLIAERREDLVKFLRASIKGWQYAVREPEKTVEVVLTYNKELTKNDQLKQLRAVLSLISGGSFHDPIGTMHWEDYQRAQEVLKVSKQLLREIPTEDIFDPSLLMSLRK